MIARFIQHFLGIISPQQALASVAYFLMILQWWSCWLFGPSTITTTRKLLTNQFFSFYSPTTFPSNLSIFPPGLGAHFPHALDGRLYLIHPLFHHCIHSAKQASDLIIITHHRTHFFLLDLNHGHFLWRWFSSSSSLHRLSALFPTRWTTNVGKPKVIVSSDTSNSIWFKKLNQLKFQD